MASIVAPYPFTGLAGRVQEAGLAVYGFGQQDPVPAFVAACDAFVFLDAGVVASPAVDSSQLQSS